MYHHGAEDEYRAGMAENLMVILYCHRSEVWYPYVAPAAALPREDTVLVPQLNGFEPQRIYTLYPMAAWRNSKLQGDRGGA